MVFTALFNALAGRAAAIKPAFLVTVLEALRVLTFLVALAARLIGVLVTLLVFRAGAFLTTFATLVELLLLLVDFRTTALLGDTFLTGALAGALAGALREVFTAVLRTGLLTFLLIGLLFLLALLRGAFDVLVTRLVAFAFIWLCALSFV